MSVLVLTITAFIFVVVEGILFYSIFHFRVARPESSKGVGVSGTPAQSCVNCHQVRGTAARGTYAQLIGPRSDFLGPDTFNQLFTIHGTTMIFFMGMPILIGFGNYLVPLMIGARDTIANQSFGHNSLHPTSFRTPKNHQGQKTYSRKLPPARHQKKGLGGEGRAA